MNSDNLNEAKDRVSEGAEQAKNRASEGVEQAKNRASEGVNRASEGVNQATDRVAEGVSQAKDRVTEGVSQAKDQVSEGVSQVKDRVSEGVSQVKDRVSEGVSQVKDSLPEGVGVVPSQPPIKPQSEASEVKSRLEWGEPALTIIDVRDRNEYNNAHILGALPISKEELAERAKTSINSSRDIYVYGETDQESAAAAQELRSAGFTHVSELKGGLAAWKAIAGPTAGAVDAQSPVGAEGYNVVSQVQHHKETQEPQRK